MGIISSNIRVEKIDSYTGHRDAVYGLSRLDVTTDFLSCSGDGYVVRWNTLAPDLGTPVAKVTNSVYTVCFDPKTNFLWIAHNFDGVHVVNLVNKQELNRTAFGNVALFDMKYFGEYILVGDSIGRLTWLDRFSGTQRKQKKISTKSIRSLAVQEKEGRVILGCSDGLIYVLDIHTGEVIYTLEGHSNSVFTLQYMENGNRLVSGGRDAHLVFWELGEEIGQQIEYIPAHLFTINSMDLSNDGRWLATGSLDKSVKIWDMTTYQLVKVIDKGRHAGHGTSVNKVMWQNESTLLTASDDRTISHWKIDFSQI